MTDKRLYPNTVIFQTTDGKGVTYYNARVLEQIRDEIEQSRYGLVNDGIDLAIKIIDKHTK